MTNSEKVFSAHRDVWSHGQVKSKLWLCEQLERAQRELGQQKPWVIWIYGGWYSMAAFLLLSRGNLVINHIRGMDIDPDASEAANIINDRWVHESGQFRSFVKDCNHIHFQEDSRLMKSAPPDLLINTACEHFDSSEWWQNLPSGQLVALQSNNMVHDEHVNKCRSLEEFAQRHPLQETHFKGEMAFEYGDDFKFDRFMLIGKK